VKEKDCGRRRDSLYPEQYRKAIHPSKRGRVTSRSGAKNEENFKSTARRNNLKDVPLALDIRKEGLRRYLKKGKSLNSARGWRYQEKETTTRRISLPIFLVYWGRVKGAPRKDHKRKWKKRHRQACKREILGLSLGKILSMVGECRWKATGRGRGWIAS